jgi:hypothetical protein
MLAGKTRKIFWDKSGLGFKKKQTVNNPCKTFARTAVKDHSKHSPDNARMLKHDPVEQQFAFLRVSTFLKKKGSES